MAWPFSQLTTYLANALPAIKAFDLNSIQTAINNLFSNHHHTAVGDAAPKIDGSTEWLPLGNVSMNGHQVTSLTGGTAVGQALAREQFAFIGGGADGYIKIPFVVAAGVSIGNLLIQWCDDDAGSFSLAANSGTGANRTCTFPTAFGSAPYYAVASTHVQGWIGSVAGVSATQAFVTVYNATAVGALSDTIKVMAIGVE